MSIQARFMGVDISEFVTSWGRLEQIKDILLAQATLLTAEMNIEVMNFRKFMNPRGPGSLIAGLDHYNGLLEIIKDGRTIYEGFVTDIRPNANAQTSVLVSENILKKPAETVINTQATDANPSFAMLDFIRFAVPEENIDARTFDQAAAPSSTSGATIDYTFAEGDNITVMQGVQLVSELSSISVFVKDNKIIARPFVPYRGQEENFKQEVNDEIAREWGAFSWDNSSFNNRVSVGFPVDKTVLLEDTESIKINGRTPRLIEFSPEDNVVASNLTSAEFFGRLYLRRAAKRRTKLNVAGGKSVDGTVIGGRFPVTTTSLGLVRFPMECIEVHQTLDSDEIELSLAQLFSN